MNDVFINILIYGLFKFKFKFKFYLYLSQQEIWIPRTRSKLWICCFQSIKSSRQRAWWYALLFCISGIVLYIQTAKIMCGLLSFCFGSFVVVGGVTGDSQSRPWMLRRSCSVLGRRPISTTGSQHHPVSTWYCIGVIFSYLSMGDSFQFLLFLFLSFFLSSSFLLLQNMTYIWSIWIDSRRTWDKKSRMKEQALKNKKKKGNTKPSHENALIRNGADPLGKHMFNCEWWSQRVHWIICWKLFFFFITHMQGIVQIQLWWTIMMMMMMMDNWSYLCVTHTQREIIWCHIFIYFLAFFLGVV